METSLILSCLLLANVWAYSELLVFSDLKTTKMTSPYQQNVVYSDFHQLHEANVLGKEPQWLWYEHGQGKKATFEAFLYSYCPQVTAYLVIRADDYFTAQVNDKAVGTGTNYGTVYTLPLKLQCGLNKLTIFARNGGGPGAVIFKVIQDTSRCYKCVGSGFYNYDTCSCQCS